MKIVSCECKQFNSGHKITKLNPPIPGANPSKYTSPVHSQPSKSIVWYSCKEKFILKRIVFCENWSFEDMYKHQVLFYALHRPWKAGEIWQLNSSYRWVELRFIYPQDGSHSYHISRLMDWEMKAERLDGSPGNVGAGMLRKDNNLWGARKEFRPGPRKASRGDSASLMRRASWTQLSGRL